MPPKRQPIPVPPYHSPFSPLRTILFTQSFPVQLHLPLTPLPLPLPNPFTTPPALPVDLLTADILFSLPTNLPPPPTPTPTGTPTPPPATIPTPPPAPVPINPVPTPVPCLPEPETPRATTRTTAPSLHCQQRHPVTSRSLKIPSRQLPKMPLALATRQSCSEMSTVSSRAQRAQMRMCVV
jgi:hypothetical protein